MIKNINLPIHRQRRKKLKILLSAIIIIIVTIPRLIAIVKFNRNCDASIHNIAIDSIKIQFHVEEVQKWGSTTQPPEDFTRQLLVLKILVPQL